MVKELFSSSFSILWYLSIRNSCPVYNESSAYGISHHGENRKNEITKKRHKTRVTRIWVLLDLNDFSRSNSPDRKTTENDSILSRKLSQFEIDTAAFQFLPDRRDIPSSGAW